MPPFCRDICFRTKKCASPAHCPSARQCWQSTCHGSGAWQRKREEPTTRQLEEMAKAGARDHATQTLLCWSFARETKAMGDSNDRVYYKESAGGPGERLGTLTPRERSTLSLGPGLKPPNLSSVSSSSVNLGSAPNTLLPVRSSPHR